MMRFHPSVWMVLAYALGILSHRSGMMPDYAVLLAALFFSILPAGATMKKKAEHRGGRGSGGQKIFCLFPVCLIACFILGDLRSKQAEQIPSCHIYHLFQSRLIRTPGTVVRIEGKLYRAPSFSREHLYLFLRVSSIQYRKTRYETKGRIRLCLRSGNPQELAGAYRAGQRITACAALYLPRGARNPGSFSYRDYLRRRGIWLTGTVKSPRLIKIIRQEKAPFPMECLFATRRYIRASIDRHFPDEAKDIMVALLLGDREEIAESEKESLKKAGVYHILAISGMHVGLLCYFMFRTVTLLNRPGFASLLCVLLALGYASVAGWGAPVSRAAVMACCYFLGRMAGLRGNIMNTLALSCFIYLLIRPLHLFDPGFQLTFAATLGIILLVPPCIKKFPILRKPAGSLIAASIAAQLSLLPLSCLYFHRITPFAVPANLLFIPLLGFTLATALCFLVLCSLGGAVAGLLAVFPASSIILMKRLAAWIAGCAWSSYRIPDPYAWVVAGYVISLALLLCRRIPFFIRAAAFCPFLFMLAVFPFPPRSVRDLTLTFLDVGSGRAILIEFPGREKILVDGGGFFGSTFDTGEHIVSPALWKYGVKQLRAVVASHGHFDHYGGLFAVLDNFRVNSLYCGGMIPSKGGYAVLLKKASDKQIPLFFPDAHHQCRISGTDVLFSIPGKEPPGLSEENDLSVALYLGYKGKGILLPSDLERKGNKRLQDVCAQQHVDILEAPHHGSRNAGPENLIDFYSPAVVVISGESGVGRTDLDQTESLCRRAGALVYRTDRHGAVTLTVRKRSIEVLPFRRVMNY